MFKVSVGKLASFPVTDKHSLEKISINLQRNHVYMYEKSKTSQVFDEINYKTQSFFEKKSKGESLKDVFNFDDSI